MKFIYAFLIVLACFIPVLVGAGFGLQALMQYCVSNSTCSSVEVCRNARCKDPCAYTKCGQNARCLVHNQEAICGCLPQHKGDPTKRCEKKCSHDRECGIHATCRHLADYGISLCECKRGYTGDPWNKCQKKCSENADCDNTETCNGQKCVEICKDVVCAKHAYCRVLYGAPICICKNCFQGNPYDRCNKMNTTSCRDAE